MKNVIKVILFLAYTVSIFMIKHDIFTVIVIGINLILTIAFKISIKEEVGNILGIIAFVILTSTINAIAVNPETGIRIGIKLILVCNLTYIFSKSDAVESIKVGYCFFMPIGEQPPRI